MRDYDFNFILTDDELTSECTGECSASYDASPGGENLGAIGAVIFIVMIVLSLFIIFQNKNGKNTVPDDIEF